MDEVAHWLVLDGGPNRAQDFERRDIVPRLAGLRPLVAVERVARVVFNQPLPAAPRQETGELVKDMLPLACGTLGGLDHQTDRAPAEPRWREGLSLHEADSLARVVDRLTPRGLAGLPTRDEGLLVGVQGLRERGRQNGALGHC